MAVGAEVRIDWTPDVFFKIFIYFLAASGLSCGTRDLSLRRVGSWLQCVGFSLVVARRLISCGVQA